MSNAPIFFAPLKVPVTDPQTGLMSRDWYLFFQAMFLRVGGAQAFTPDDNQITGEMDDATEDGNDIRASVADFERVISSLDEPPLSTDLAELQALSASFSEDPIIARFTAQWDGLTPASGGGAVKFLRADGAWAVPAYPTVPVGANPTASVGPAVVNGVAPTFMRSDAAPPIDLTAAYTWSGTHVFAAGTQTQMTSTATNFNPLAFFATGQAANNKAWMFRFGGSADLLLYAADDTGGPVAAGIALDCKRSGTSISEIDFGNATANPVYQFLGTGLVTVNGDLKVVGKSGFNNTAPIAKPTVTGSKGANAALASVLTALANYGLITDSST